MSHHQTAAIRVALALSLVSCALVTHLIHAQAAPVLAKTPQQSSAGNYIGDRVGNRLIDGVVLNAKTGLPIANADVTVTRTKDRTAVGEIVTDSEGRFSFPGLPDGKFAVRAARRGYIAAAYQQHESASTAIVTGDGLVSTGLEFRLEPQAVLYGTVAEDSGDPVPQAQIALYLQDTSGGTGRIIRSKVAVADEQGNFEIARLAPGKYYVSVAGHPWYATRPQFMVGAGKVSDSQPRSQLDVAYATTYYSDATDSAYAASLPVAAGERVPVNFTLHPVPAIHITIYLPPIGSDRRFPIPELRQDVFGTEGLVQPTYNFFQTSEDRQHPSMVEMSGIAPGHYDVGLLGTNGEISRETSVNLAADEAVDLANTTALAEVTGKFAPANGRSFTNSLMAQLSLEGGDRQFATPVERDGSFQFHPLPPGTYTLSLHGFGYPMALTQITASGATVDGHLLRIGSEPVIVAALASESNATVSGIATLADKPTGGVFVLLVPVNLSLDRDFWRINQSDSDGSFDFSHILPGSYTVVAIQEGWTLDWARPEAISRFLAQGTRVTVPPHATQVDLKESVQIQAK